MTVSRKSLSAAGAKTPVFITVTAADKKTRAVYLVTVAREAKAESGGKPASSTGKTKAASSEKPQAGGKKSGSKSSGSFTDRAESALAAAKKGKSVSSVAPEALTETVSAVRESAAPTVGLAAAAPLTVVQDRMPSYLVGMLAAGSCIVTGVLLWLWLGGKKK